MRHPYKTAFLLFGDIITLYVSLFAMLLIRYGSIANAPLFQEHIIPFGIVFVLWIATFYIHGLYDLTEAKNNLEFFTSLGRAVVVSLVLAIALFYFVPFFEITPKTNLFITLGLFALLFSLWRQFINRTLRKYFQQNVLVVGPLREVSRLVEIFDENPQMGYRISLVFTEKKPESDSLPFVVHTPDEFPKIAKLAKQYNVRTVIVSEEAYRNTRIVRELEKLLSYDVEIVTLEDTEERISRRVKLADIDEFWFFDYFAKYRRVTYGTIKRLVDIVMSLILMPISVLIGLFVALFIRLEDKGPIFYTQTRVGEHGKEFTMYKFRTMRPNAERDGAQWTVADDPRVTRIGRFLRKTRLDELPQIINVIGGDMSFVGPRAERPEFHSILKKEIPFYERRYLIRPGLTGWAQINYTYGSSVEDTRTKLSYDLYYLKYRSLIFDLGIILKTIDLVLRGSGR